MLSDDEVDDEFEPRPIRNWASLLYDIWRLEFKVYLYAIRRVQWQLDFFGDDVDGPEEPEEEP